jgi:translation initiation factor 3 subunit B
VIRYDQETEIYWNTVGSPGERPRLEFKRSNWTESYVMWSPLGTYLVTFHQLGIILWGGPSWKRLHKFQHPGVKLVDFSPNERYIITFSQSAADQTKTNNTEKSKEIFVWDVRSGQKMIEFKKVSNNWPAFRWSHDSKYFARINPEKGVLNIYQTPEMSLLNRVKLHGPIQDFCWSPTESVFSAWIPETENIPARMFLMQVPSMTTLQQKNLYNVKGVCT